MEDIKVYFHGRPHGQDIWGVREGDIAGSYLGQVLNWTYGKDLPACMIIDHWNGDTYYSYIHRKGVFEKAGARKDAYCAITLRIVHSECHNVATLYELLKTAYEQLVDKAIQVNNNRTEWFLITKFSDIQEYLSEISLSVLKNFESHDKLKNSIFPLREAKNTNDQIVSYALQEVDSPAFKKDAELNRILISEYLKPKTNFLKGQVDKLKTEKDRLQTKLTNISDEISANYDKVLQEKEDKISQLEQELQSEREKRNHIEEQDSNNIKDINQIIEIARHLASRFPDSCQKSIKENCSSEHKDSSLAIPEVWYRWIVIVFLILLLVCSIVLLVNINRNGGNYPKQDNPTEQSDTAKITEYSLTIHIDPIPVDNKLIVNTEYLLSLSDEDLECKWYYEDNQGEHLLDNNVLCPKTPNSYIRIKAVVDRDSVAISEFYTIDAAKTSNTGTATKGIVTAKISPKGTTAKGTDAAKTSPKRTTAKGTEAAKTSPKGTTAKGTESAKTSNNGTVDKGKDAANEGEVSP